MTHKLARAKRTEASVNDVQEGMLVEVAKKTKFTLDSDKKNVQDQQKKRFPWLQVFFGIFLTLLLTITLTVWKFISTFEQISGARATDLVKQIRTGMTTEAFADGRENFLLLGIDDVQSRTEDAALTDTIMILSAEADGSVTVVSLPRDLWIEPFKAKVNYLYYLGEQTEPGQGKVLVESVIEEITGLHIDHTIVVKLALVEMLIDTIGGIEVDVTNSFTDTKFPRENVDLTSTDPTVLYETIHFTAGRQHFDGKTSLKFIRSRHSDDLTEGTDLGRMRRQQQVISALASGMRNKDLYLNAYTLGKLYKLWKTEVETTLTEANLVSIARKLLKTQISIRPIQLPIEENGKSGIIYHPTNTSIKPWIFVPHDPSWKELREWFAVSL